MPAPGAGGVQASLTGMVQGMMASARNAFRRKPPEGIPGPGLAAIRAGYSGKTASVIGHQNLKKTSDCRRDRKGQGEACTVNDN